jgi:hypothetical protein
MIKMPRWLPYFLIIFGFVVSAFGASEVGQQASVVGLILWALLDIRDRDEVKE